MNITIWRLESIRFLVLVLHSRQIWKPKRAKRAPITEANVTQISTSWRSNFLLEASSWAFWCTRTSLALGHSSVNLSRFLQERLNFLLRLIGQQNKTWWYLPRCLKIKEKVSFYIAIEASYVYILSGQKFKKMPKMVPFGKFLKPKLAVKQCCQTGQFYRTKIDEKCQNWII